MALQSTEFDFDSLPSQSKIQTNVNKRFDELFCVDPLDKLHKPYVCTFCDEYIMHVKDQNWMPLSTLKATQNALRWEKVLLMEDRVADIEAYYRLPKSPNPVERNRKWLFGVERSR